MISDNTTPKDSPPDDLLAEIVGEFPDCGWDLSKGQRVVIVAPDSLVPLAEWLQNKRFAMCVDVTGADYLDHFDRSMGNWQGEPTRFEVVVNLLNLAEKQRLRLRVPVDELNPRCPTLTFVWPSADAAEREVFDMFGISFDGHPDLTRILMPDDWEGHPLRKDFMTATIPVTFKDDVTPVGSPVEWRGTKKRPAGSSPSPSPNGDKKGAQ